MYVCTVGGVDFSKSPKRSVTRVRFDVENPGLDKTTRTSVRTVTTYRDTDTVFMGGSGNGSRPAPGEEDPAPEPTPTDPDGDLADTGSGLPVGLLSGIAAAVVAAGDHAGVVDATPEDGGG